MGYIVTVDLLLLGVFFHRKQGTWACPEALFCYEWTLISFLASLRLFGLYEASWHTWIIIYVGSISFVVGCCGGRMTNVNTNHIEKGDICDKKIISDRMFWIFAATIVIYTIPGLMQSIHYMRLGISLGDIRNASVGMGTIQGYTNRTGALWEYIDYGISVMELLVTGYGISEYIKSVKNDGYKYILTVMIIAIIRAFAYGGRFGLAYVIIEILVCMNLNRITRSNLFSRVAVKQHRRVKVIVLLLVLIIVVVTLIRGAETSELLKKYYRYICGNVVFFDLHVQEMSMQSVWSFTFAGFYGFWAFVLPILHGLGFDYPQIYLDTISQIMDGQTFRRIGDGLSTNAFITPFYHLYADFRMPGVILGMMLFGWIAGLLYKKCLVNRDNYSVVCYLILTQMIFKSLQTYPFASKTYVLFFVVIWILGKRITIKGK